MYFLLLHFPPYSPFEIFTAEQTNENLSPPSHSASANLPFEYLVSSWESYLPGFTPGPLLHYAAWPLYFGLASASSLAVSSLDLSFAPHWPFLIFSAGQESSCFINLVLAGLLLPAICLANSHPLQIFSLILPLQRKSP